MRLLQLGANDELTITRDIVPDSTPYAILSHTWGTGGDDEVTFQDVTQKKGKRKPGYQKILFCGKQAKRDGLKYFWVDTCCIDKTSSAELSEAINSMYRCAPRSLEVGNPDDNTIFVVPPAKYNTTRGQGLLLDGNSGCLHATDLRRRREDEAFIRLYKDLEHRYQVKPGYTRLEMAARTSHETLLALLLKAGATINSKDPKGFTPLARAAEYGHEIAVQVLLNQGANIELKNNKDFSPLSIAAWEGHETVIRVLLGAGADTESRDYDRDTPLANAAFHGHTAAIQALLGGGAKINPTNKYGHTPLRRAAQNGHKKAARVVQNAGAR
ncbi:hypothetical protein TruAng_007826 [Truncatella angustata]|nr:hypothetical protein TruAng_007826 [Truncatella angustata]